MKQPFDLQSVIEFHIAERIVWPISETIWLLRKPAIWLWLKNDGDKINLHFATPNRPGRLPTMRANEHLVIILYLGGSSDGGAIWKEMPNWRTTLEGWVKEHELTELL